MQRLTPNDWTKGGLAGLLLAALALVGWGLLALLRCWNGEGERGRGELL